MAPRWAPKFIALRNQVQVLSLMKQKKLPQSNQNKLKTLGTPRFADSGDGVSSV